MKATDKHVPLDELAAWTFGGLDPADETRIRDHLASGCRRCGGELLWLEWTAQMARDDQSVAPPPAVLRRVIAGYRRPTRPGLYSLEPRRVRVIFDSMLSPAPAFTRGAGIADRQVLYDVPDTLLQVDLLVQHDERRDGAWHLTGQLLSGAADQPLVAVAVRSAAGEETNGVIYPTGEFSAEFATTGPHVLILYTAKEEIGIPVPEP